MSTKLAKKELAVPKEWADVRVPVVDANLYDGTHISVRPHDIQVATRYPTFENGTVVGNVTQAQAAEFLRSYNEANGCAFRYPTLFQDERMRDQLGRDHVAFDENFERNGNQWRQGYVADFTRPYGSGAEGINRQQLVTRTVGWRLLAGDKEVGVTTIAPSGIVPTLRRKQLEKLIGPMGLKRLEKLRGREIYEKDEELVDVRNALGYPQLTFGHNETYEGGIMPHSHHVYTPSQGSGERGAVRGACWGRHDGLGCFCVSLGIGPESSDPDGSFPLVRGEPVEAKVTRPSYTIITRPSYTIML